MHDIIYVCIVLSFQRAQILICTQLLGRVGLKGEMRSLIYVSEGVDFNKDFFFTFRTFSLMGSLTL